MKIKIRVSSKQKLINQINNGIHWNKKFAWFPKICDHHLGDFRSWVWLSFYYERLALYMENEYATGDYHSAKAKLIPYELKESEYQSPGSAWRLSSSEYTALTIEDSPLIKFYSTRVFRDKRYHWRMYKNSTKNTDRIKFEDEDRY